MNHKADLSVPKPSRRRRPVVYTPGGFHYEHEADDVGIRRLTITARSREAERVLLDAFPRLSRELGRELETRRHPRVRVIRRRPVL